MKKLQISNKDARKLVLKHQLFRSGKQLSKGKYGVLQLINKLGYVQIDTISVVQRAHHQTIWARKKDYSPEMLHELQAIDRSVFEYWGHAMSFLPMADYRFYLPRMKSFFDPYSKWEQDRLQKCSHLMEPVLERIRDEGPLSSKDFIKSTDKKQGSWRDHRPAKIALEMLFWRGELMISERRNFRRFYDLTERVLPDNVCTRFPDDDELGQFLVRRALMVFGVANESEIRDHIRAAGKSVITKSLQDMVESGEVVEIQVDRNEQKTNFTLPQFLNEADKSFRLSNEVFLLSPFDNLIIQRDRMKRLFGFDYTLECYVPAAKRKFGYFVFPILWKDRFVGRLDPKAERKTKTLIICNLVFEAEFKVTAGFLKQFTKKLQAFAEFNACDRIRFENCQSKKIIDEIKSCIISTGFEVC